MRSVKHSMRLNNRGCVMMIQISALETIDTLEMRSLRKTMTTMVIESITYSDRQLLVGHCSSKDLKIARKEKKNKRFLQGIIMRAGYGRGCMMHLQVRKRLRKGFSIKICRKLHQFQALIACIFYLS